MTIYFELVQRVLNERLQQYIKDSEGEDQSYVLSAWGRSLDLSAKKRLFAQQLIEAISVVNLSDDNAIQTKLDTLLRTCKEQAADANLEFGGTEGHLEALIDDRRAWLERLLKKTKDNNLINIPSNKHPFSIFCQKMAKYFDQKIYEELTEWRATHTVRQTLGFTSMPLEKELIIRKKLVECMKKLARLSITDRDYPDGVKDEIIGVLKALQTENSGVSVKHAVPISAPLPILGGVFGFFRLPLGKAQPSDGFLGKCIAEAIQEINTQTNDSLGQIVSQSKEEFNAIFEKARQVDGVDTAEAKEEETASAAFN